jgi:hypothetical protein
LLRPSVFLPFPPTSAVQAFSPTSSPAGFFVSQTMAEAESLRVFNLENKVTKERKKPQFY